MKLSEVKGERTLDVIAEIVPAIINIAAGETAKELFSVKKLPEGESPASFALQRLKKGLPMLIKEHKKDIVTVLAAIKGVTQDAYVSEMNLASIFVDCTDLLMDEAFVQLFQQAQSQNCSISAPMISEAEA